MNAGMMEPSEYHSRIAAWVLQCDQMRLDLEDIRDWLEASGHFDAVVELDDDDVDFDDEEGEGDGP